MTISISSAYYKYTTNDGTVCFVERLDTVPPRYRTKAIEIGYTRERSDKMSEEIDSTTSAGSHKVQDSAETSSSGFRWNFVMLVLLFVLGFFIARRIEQRGLFKHASQFRCITFFLVVVLQRRANLLLSRGRRIRSH
jgi:hypothetical protein